MRKFLLVWILFLSVFTFAQTSVSVNVSAPVNNSKLTSPVSVKACATPTSGHAISGWAVYANSSKVWSQTTGTNCISGSFALLPGSYSLTVRAWDTSGKYGSVALTETVLTTVRPTTVTVTSPVAGSVVSSPVDFQAIGDSQNGISGWAIYENGNTVYKANTFSNSLNAPVMLAPGQYNFTIRAWDNGNGTYGSASLALTVRAANMYVTPPSNALIFKQEQNNPLASWKQTTSEAGGQIASDYWTKDAISSPSLSGSSREFHITGGAWVSALWYHKLNLTSSESAQYTHVLMDYDYYVDQASLSVIHTLEYDTMLIYNGHEYMVGSHCNFDNGHWYGWNQATHAWIQLPAPCTRSLLPGGKWHHVQWLMQRVAGSNDYKYDTLIVDNVVYNIDLTEPASSTSWGQNITVQWQVDINGSGGTANQYIDNVRVALW